MIPLVSILIPAYNSEKWIQATLDSVFGQTWSRNEIIVVDDGSSDRTVEIARRYAGRNVKIVEGEHRGAAAARNLALSLAQGEYIQWLDSDDLLGPQKIARQMEAVNRDGNRKTLYSCAVGRFYWRLDHALFTKTVLWTDHKPLDWLILKFSDNVFLQPAAWLVSRSLSEMAGPWDERLTNDDDGEYFCRVIRASDHVRFVPEARVYYRKRASGSLANIGRDTKKLDSLWLSMKLQIQQIRASEDSPRVRAACLQYMQCSFPAFYPEREEIVTEARKLAAELGGELAIPEIGWKYAWLRSAFGWSAAKSAQIRARNLRARAAERCDWLAFQWQAESKYRNIPKLLHELE